MPGENRQHAAAGVLVLAGDLLPGLRAETIGTFIAAAHEAHIKTILALEGNALRPSFEPAPFARVLDREQAERILERELTGEAAVHEIAGRSRAAITVIIDGPNVVATDARRIWRAQVHDGAREAIIAGIAVGALRGLEVSASLGLAG